MADFKTHTVGAALISGIAATALFMTGEMSNLAVVGYFLLGVMGGLLPDIDSDTSVPLRIASHVLAVIGGFLALFTFGQRLSLVELVILWLACFLTIRYGIFSIFTRITVHRGLIHSLPAGVGFALLAVLIAYHLVGSSALQAWFCGLFVFLGFIVHLLLDEFYSVNLVGMQLKRSFGTAFNLGTLSNPYGTLALYIVLMGLFYISPSPNSFMAFMMDGDIHNRLIDRLLPQQGWFNSSAVR
jgi:hypothetical protein